MDIWIVACAAAVFCRVACARSDERPDPTRIETTGKTRISSIADAL
jgi:hypothetical protein